MHGTIDDILKDICVIYKFEILTDELHLMDELRADNATDLVFPKPLSNMLKIQ